MGTFEVSDLSGKCQAHMHANSFNVFLLAGKIYGSRASCSEHR